MHVRRGPAVLALSLVLATPLQAAADPPGDEAEAEAAARTLGGEALGHFQAGRWQQAYALLQLADQRFHAPTLVVYMGHCQARLGNLVAARRHYREAAREALAPDAPAQFRTAQAAAAQELRWTEQRLGIVQVTVTGAPAGQARVLVDGVEAPAAELDALGVLPGEHVVEASGPGGTTARRTITLKAGQTEAVELPLPPPPRTEPPPISPPASRPEAAAPPLRLPGGLSLPVPSAVSLGVGVAALLAGTVTGVISLRTAGNVKAQCSPAGVCPTSVEADAALAGRLADASTATLVVGGGAIVAGIVLWAVEARSHGATVRVEARPGYGAIQGAF
jgi:hypothetical protein